MRCVARIGGLELPVEVASGGAGRFTARTGADAPVIHGRRDGALVLLEIGGRTLEAAVTRANDGVAGAGDGSVFTVTIGGRLYEVRIDDPRRAAAAGAALRPAGPAEVRAFMPGKVVALLAAPGDLLRPGQGVVVIEAMKMENELTSPKEGRLRDVHVRPGDTVETGTPLFTVE
ncbi:MAG: acetyl-CoA carboxylase biotin carboxyl carrier protein subunit [Candidatus Polarisedimenticolia bacterium]